MKKMLPVWVQTGMGQLLNKIGHTT